MKFVSLDPGDVHVGWAVFADDNHGEFHCTLAEEITPDELFRRARETGWLQQATHVVIEEFRPYPTTIKALIGSDLPTARMIGAMEYACHTWGVQLIKQPAHVKKATEELLKHKHIELVSRGHGGHAKDAELQGYYRLFSQGLLQ